MIIFDGFMTDQDKLRAAQNRQMIKEGRCASWWNVYEAEAAKLKEGDEVTEEFYERLRDKTR